MTPEGKREMELTRQYQVTLEWARRQEDAFEAGTRLLEAEAAMEIAHFERKMVEA